MPELLTVVEAAQRLSMSHSTVSRHLAKSGVVRDGAGRFDFDAFTAWRAKTINPLKARNVDMDFALDRHEASGQVAPEAKPLRAAPPPGGQAGLGFGKAATAEKAVRAQLLKLDLDQRTGKLARVDDLEMAGEQLAGLLQEALRRRNKDMAEALAAETDRHRVQAMLQASDRELLIVLGHELVKVLQPFQPAPGQPAPQALAAE